MGNTVIKVENLSKQYRLGLVGASTFKEDTSRWWAKIRGKEDPFISLGEENDRTSVSESKFVWSLRDINFEVHQGDVLGIIGRNGAGKSTLLKILSKITSPTKGSVKARGRLASLLEVGTGFHPELTGKENIYLNGAILGMRKHEITRKIDEIIAFSGVERYIDTPVKRYSSGMYVRLAFAVAAHLESEILIVDEVLAVGDFEFQNKCLGKMNDLSKSEGRTVLFVSHNMAAIKQLCNVGLLLDKGKLGYYGSIDESINRYLVKINKNKNVSIKQIKDRSGTQLVVIEDLYLKNSINQKIDIAMTGEDLYIIIELFALEDVERVNVGLSFHDVYDELITYLYSAMQNNYFTLHKGKNTISLMLNQFPLNTKLIKVRGRVLVGEVESDWPKINLLEFSIEKGDFYNTGKIPELNSSILINGNWSII
jgi:lipopolysaccharide transport system ATP-binding protein